MRSRLIAASRSPSSIDPTAHSATSRSSPASAWRIVGAGTRRSTQIQRPGYPRVPRGGQRQILPQARRAAATSGVAASPHQMRRQLGDRHCTLVGTPIPRVPPRSRGASSRRATSTKHLALLQLGASCSHPQRCRGGQQPVAHGPPRCPSMSRRSAAHRAARSPRGQAPTWWPHRRRQHGRHRLGPGSASSSASIRPISLQGYGAVRQPLCRRRLLGDALASLAARTHEPLGQQRRRAGCARAVPSRVIQARTGSSWCASQSGDDCDNSCAVKR